MASIGCIKRRNTASGMTEVHELRRDGSAFDFHTSTAITLEDDPNFTYDFKINPDGNHYFTAIKITNTDSGFVEVHQMSRDSGYQSFVLQAATPITLADAPNFDFMLGQSNGDLVCVKRHNTGTGRVEVHVVSNISSYQEFIYQGPTPFTVPDAVNFDFRPKLSSRVVDTLIGIKRRNTDTQAVELHALQSGYGPFDFQIGTSISLPEADGLIFLFDNQLAAQSLVGIRGAGFSGFMEIVDLRDPYSGVPVIRRSVLPSSDVPNFDFKFMQSEIIVAVGG